MRYAKADAEFLENFALSLVIVIPKSRNIAQRTKNTSSALRFSLQKSNVLIPRGNHAFCVASHRGKIIPLHQVPTVKKNDLLLFLLEHKLNKEM